MNKNLTRYFICGLLLMVQLSFSNHLNAQVERDSPLYKILKWQDSLLFDVGFNTCDIDQIRTLSHEDFENYHDQG